MWFIFTDDKFESSFSDNLHIDAYKVHMKLTIKDVEPTDYASYKCISKNSLGSTDGTIGLYRNYLLTFIIISTNNLKLNFQYIRIIID